MQHSWFTVPWVQFQQIPGLTGIPAGNPQVTTLGGSMAPPPSPSATLTPQQQMNSLNGIPTAVNGMNSLGVNGMNSVNGLNLHSLNGINGLNSLNSIGGLNGLSSIATPGGLVAIPGPGSAQPQGHPTLALHQVLRRPQAIPPPIAALIRAKKDPADLIPAYKREKRKAEDDYLENQEIKKAKLETKALKAKRPGFSEERYNETSYYIENGLRKVYPYYFTFTTFTKGRWVGEKILDVFAKEFRAHPAEEYERCIKSGTLTVNYEKVDTDYRLKHNDLLANIVHRHEVPVTAEEIPLVHVDEEMVVVDKPASIPVHPCGRYRHNTVVFILAKEYNLKNLRTIHRLDRLTSGLLLFGRTPKKAREMEQQIRTRQVTKQYVCRVEGEFPLTMIECNEPIEVVSYKIGVCKVSPNGKECRTEFRRLSYNGRNSVVLCRPYTGRMHQIRVHLQYLGFPIVNDPLYNHTVFGANKGKGGIVGKTDEQLIQDLIKIHNAENWLGMDGDAEYSMFKGRQKDDNDEEGSQRSTPSPKGKSSPVGMSPRIVSPPMLTPAGPIYSYVNTPHIGQDYTQGQNHLNGDGGVKVAQTNSDGSRDYNFKPHFMTVDPHCYECKVKYRDPKPRDLVMYLHALKYSGPGWHFETKMPDWAHENWKEPKENH